MPAGPWPDRGTMNHLSPGGALSPAFQGAGSPEVSPRVMVVDDSSTARLMVEGLLKDSGFETQGFSDGASALAQMASFQPDLVILDILMPGMDGLEVCRRLRALEGGSGIPVLFLTGDERSETQEQAIAVGGDDLVYKPSLQRELVIRARSLLRIRQLQSALEAEAQALRVLQDKQEGLFRFIVHDLKTPLQAIRSGAEMVLGDADATPEILSMTGLIQQGSIMLEGMVQDILVVCHRGHLVPNPQPIHLRESVESWLEAVSAGFTRKKVAVANEIPPDLVVDVDVDLLRRCVLNLLDNAQKYGPRGNTVRVQTSVSPAEWVLNISDQGPGIPAGMEETIFDPFARLERDVSQVRVSSGLGLAFCREVAQAHGGRIWVENGDPAGAVFSLALPRKG